MKTSSEPLTDLPDSSLKKSESKNSLEVPSHLTGAALARRLNVSPSTLRHKKNAPNFVFAPLFRYNVKITGFPLFSSKFCHARI
ncbi:hypothetical protein [Nostoc sp.]|uniref:hypothetical protein n=1 Tax=Nostoc sp. TaxID=1180 RepID=UPI002FFC2A28